MLSICTTKLDLTCVSYQSLPSPNENDIGAVDHVVVRPIRDEELRAAINALKQSTAAIERHTKSLEAQKRALLKLKAEREGEDTSTSILDPKEDDHRLRLRESSQLTFAVSSHDDRKNTRCFGLTGADRRLATLKL